MRRSLAVVLVASAALAACGGTSEDEEVTAALTASLLSDPTFTEYDITEDEASCVAERAVADLGTDRMIEIGFTDEAAEQDFSALSDEEIGTLATAMDDCLADLDRVLADAVAEGILEDPDPDFPVTDEEAACVAASVTEALGASRLIVLGVRSDESGSTDLSALEPAETEAFSEAFLGCVDVRAILLQNLRGEDVDDQTLACLDVNITDADIGALFTASFRGEDATESAARILAPAINACT